MGKAKGRNISKVKKTNIKRNKQIKAGKLKPKSKPNFVEGGQFKKKGKKQILTAEQLERRKQYEEEKKQNEELMYKEMADMMDPEDLEYLKKNASRSKAFQIEAKKRKRDEIEEENEDSNDDEGFEDYEKSAVKRIKESSNENSGQTKRDLLPIRSQNGKWEQRSMKIDENPSDNESEPGESESEDEVQEPKNKEPVRVIDILAQRQDLIADAKLQIGSMATNFLENPEERIFLLDKLIKFMTLGHNEASVEKTIIKLASATILEIFKDVLPNYKILDHEESDSTVKLKKETLKLHKYETSLLNCVKRYLVKLERIVSEKDNLQAPHALKCMLEILLHKPEFNFMENIVQFCVPYLNSHLRFEVAKSIEKLFKQDKKGQISYFVVKTINAHMKVIF